MVGALCVSAAPKPKNSPPLHFMNTILSHALSFSPLATFSHFISLPLSSLSVYYYCHWTQKKNMNNKLYVFIIIIIVIWVHYSVDFFVPITCVCVCVFWPAFLYTLWYEKFQCQLKIITVPKKKKICITPNVFLFICCS